MPAAGGAATFIASAQGGRGPHFARNDAKRVYLTASRGLQSITHGRLRPPHATSASPGTGPGNNPPAADEIRLSPDGTRAFVSLQGKHFLVTVPHGRPRDGRRPHPGPRRQRRRAGEAHVAPKAATTCSGRADGKSRDVGAGARSSSGRPSTPPTRRRPTSSSSCRARGRRDRCCSPAPASSR